MSYILDTANYLKQVNKLKNQFKIARRKKYT